MVQYVILNEWGILPDNDLETYCQPGGRLGAHPDYGVPGVTASTGSLGHGMGIGVGLSYGDKLLQSDKITYIIISDGELQEGSTWEAIMMAGNLCLSNLVVFLDLNDFSGLERMSDAHKAFYPVTDKVEAFGWHVLECDGHDGEALYDTASSRCKNKPTFIICKTVKGKGVSFMENVPIWHYRSPNKMEYAQALDEIDDDERYDKEL